jgi:hypothetical protein
LASINEKLNECYKTIDNYKTQVSKLEQFIHTVGFVALGLVLLKVIGFILYMKGVKVPRGIDILI